MRRPLDVPLDREVGFVSFVRASSEAKLRVCVRDIMFFYACLRIFELYLLFVLSSPLIDCCVLPGFCNMLLIIVAICIGLMTSRVFAWY